jgi:hypothetical protein
MTQFQVSPNSVFVAGKQLGAGTYGRVFLCANNDSVVIKVEEDYDYDNVFLGEACIRRVGRFQLYSKVLRIWFVYGF